ncbi:hypothetical protein [Endozoicomonas ascidiicola]|uniref:hypothetical protein n=1 Tax=Endozoicomonas ascidiicola TaxID=1698521 RepID=UPI000B25584A|nr:hypothetical protein [Endozoicomonas ascidiicola]
MKLKEVLSYLEQNPGGSFTAISYDETERFMKVYQASNNVSDPEWITVWYDGSELFSGTGEEESYTPDELPAEVSDLNFQPSKELPSILGYTSEHSAHLLFPELPDPEFLATPQEKRDFANQLATIFRDRH